MDMNIQKYMAFVKAVEYGSFTKAAEILNYSQSGISRMINDLEKEWQVVPVGAKKDRGQTDQRRSETASLAVRRFLEYLEYR